MWLGHADQWTEREFWNKFTCMENWFYQGNRAFQWRNGAWTPRRAFKTYYFPEEKVLNGLIRRKCQSPVARELPVRF